MQTWLPSTPVDMLLIFLEPRPTKLLSLISMFANVSAKQTCAHHSYKGSLKTLGHARLCTGPEAFVPGPLAGHCPSAPFTVPGWSGSHVAIAVRVSSGATQPLRREFVRWAGWAVWRVPHGNWAELWGWEQKRPSTLFVTLIAANPEAAGMLRVWLQTPSL